MSSSNKELDKLVNELIELTDTYNKKMNELTEKIKKINKPQEPIYVYESDHMRYNNVIEHYAVIHRSPSGVHEPIFLKPHASSFSQAQSTLPIRLNNTNSSDNNSNNITKKRSNSLFDSLELNKQGEESQNFNCNYIIPIPKNSMTYI